MLVCLFLCTACRQEKTEFVAGEKAVLHTEKTEELSETPEETSVKMEENLLPKLVNINTADEKELMSLPGIGRYVQQRSSSTDSGKGILRKLKIL